LTLSINSAITIIKQNGALSSKFLSIMLLFNDKLIKIRYRKNGIVKIRNYKIYNNYNIK